MNLVSIVIRSLKYYWPTNLAVISGVSVAVAVLAGSLLVGNSVNKSLQKIALTRLGQTDLVLNSNSYFTEALANRISSHPLFAQLFNRLCPMFITEGGANHPKTGRRSSRISVYGIDKRFWSFHRLTNYTKFATDRQALISLEVARDLRVQTGDSILLRIEKPSHIPRDFLHGKREQVGRTIRLTVTKILSAAELGDFSLKSQQGAVRAIFVPLLRLQKDLEVAHQINTILIKSRSPRTNLPQKESREEINKLLNILRESYSISDTSLNLRILHQESCISLESSGTLLNDEIVATARDAASKVKFKTRKFFTYLSNSIQANTREIPYSLVTALDLGSAGLEKFLPSTQVSTYKGPPPIILNQWAAHELDAQTNDLVNLIYYLWSDSGELLTHSKEFKLSGIISMKDPIIDRNLAPIFPGITESTTLVDWDPPFPMNLSRISIRDELYWDKFKTTPKALIPLKVGQQLWKSRHGQISSLRIYPPKEFSSKPNPNFLKKFLLQYKTSLLDSLTPKQIGFSVRPVIQEAVLASQGATDFGQYFIYFSFFLMSSALLLTILFFKLGLEQRIQEIGIFRTLGYSESEINLLFLSEGAILAIIGTVIGLGGAVAYTNLILTALQTWWVDAVGTNLLTTHLSIFSLIIGGSAGLLTALICIALTLRSLRNATILSLLKGSWLQNKKNQLNEYKITTKISKKRRVWFFYSPTGSKTLSNLIILSFLVVAILLGSIFNIINQTLGFFVAGTLVLVLLLYFQSIWLGRKFSTSQMTGNWQISRLGFRNVIIRPGRSLLCIALIASAAFIIVTVESFRRDQQDFGTSKTSSTGGFSLIAESLVPIHHDLNSKHGQESLNLLLADNPSLSGVHYSAFRLKPGDDTSCLNLYQPTSPRILGASNEFLKSERFQFHSALETSNNSNNPWDLLNQKINGDVIPVITDANSMQYVLHMNLGDQFVLNPHGSSPIKLKLVGALKDSLFQSELIMSETNFLQVFPNIAGFRFFLLETSVNKKEIVTNVLEHRLSDYGIDIMPTSVRMANFHRVENTYLSTFQALGGLGLLLGTIGLAIVLLRNVLERRKELALLSAVGYNWYHLTWIIIAENLFLLSFGLINGLVSALLSIAPVFQTRGGDFPFSTIVALLGGVLLTGLVASLIATFSVTRKKLLPSLKSE